MLLCTTFCSPPYGCFQNFLPTGSSTINMFNETCTITGGAATGGLSQQPVTFRGAGVTGYGNVKSLNITQLVVCMCISVCPSVCSVLSLGRSVGRSFCLLSVCLSAVCLSVFCLSVCFLSVCLSVSACTSVGRSVCERLCLRMSWRFPTVLSSTGLISPAWRSTCHLFRTGGWHGDQQPHPEVARCQLGRHLCPTPSRESPPEPPHHVQSWIDV